MNFLLDSTQTLIIILVSCGVVVLGVIWLLLAKFVFSHRKAKKQIRDLERKYEYLHALLIGQDAQYLKRIEYISRTNLLYVDIHTTFSRRYKEAREKHDVNAWNAILELKDIVAEGKYKSFKDMYNKNKRVVSSYESVVISLNEDLVKLIKPEEDCRQEALGLKEKLRNIKQEYLVHTNELSLVTQSFEDAFAFIDSLFQDNENLIESAEYAEANKILPKISKALRELEKSVTLLPNLCASITVVIPSKVLDLQNQYNELTAKDYPLHHLLVKTGIEDINFTLGELTTKVKNLETDGVDETILTMSKRIDDYLLAFDEEKKAREIFDQDQEEIFKNVSALEKNFIKLCNTIPSIKKIYLLSDKYVDKIDEIQGSIDVVSLIKRSLDTYIHSSTKQPYSKLVDKLHELKEKSDLVATSINDFESYLASLKKDVDTSYSLIYVFYGNLKKSEKALRDLDIEQYSSRFTPQFDSIYSYIDTIDNTLKVLPIDVEKINEITKKLNTEGEALISTIERDNNFRVLAEDAIVYANRDRMHQSDAQQYLLRCEEMFFEGNFQNAYVETGKLLKKLRGSSGEEIEE